jgi:hypothetical protein
MKEKLREKNKKTPLRRVNGPAQHRSHAGGVEFRPANGRSIGIAKTRPSLLRTTLTRQVLGRRIADANGLFWSVCVGPRTQNGPRSSRPEQCAHRVDAYRPRPHTVRP